MECGGPAWDHHGTVAWGHQSRPPMTHAKAKRVIEILLKYFSCSCSHINNNYHHNIHFNNQRFTYPFKELKSKTNDRTSKTTNTQHNITCENETKLSATMNLKHWELCFDRWPSHKLLVVRDTISLQIITIYKTTVYNNPNEDSILPSQASCDVDTL